MPERCFLEVLRESKPQTPKRAPKCGTIYGIKKKKLWSLGPVFTSVLGFFCLFLPILGTETHGLAELVTVSMLWVKHGVGSQR